ncbi:VWA domain-containing protein [Flavobacteriaceae bacterium]|nr:VWA domain-containing protein [Flavobacteriaceae bacterium]
MILYIIGSGILALIVAFFQYIYKMKRNPINWILATLRFITLFSLILLIVNPKFDNNVIKDLKPTLVVAVDNSESIKYLNKDSLSRLAIESILGNSELSEKYNIKIYSFGKKLNQNKSLNFNEKQTNITKAIQDIESIYESQIAPIVLISDGNQTIGTNYGYASKAFKQAVFPLTLGDSIFNTDLKIQQINVNKYAYLNNKFPVEIFCSYSGNKTLSTELTISSDNNIIHKERLEFSPEVSSRIITPLIKTTKVGQQAYQVYLKPIKNEKNKVNNLKYISVETIDELSKVALISTMSHPDIGALKTSIETNEHRLVDLLKPEEFIMSKESYGLVVLYQPNTEFKEVFERTKKMNNNTFIIGGISTQWRFLNEIQSDFYQEVTGQNESFNGNTNLDYMNFNITDYSFISHPPLTTEFGQVSINTQYETLLYKSINGILTNEPLWFTYENNASRNSVLLAENLWKWRMYSFQQNLNFVTFDSFIAKVIQYLDVKNLDNRLILDYQSIYDGGQKLEISAQYFNKNYELDSNADIGITFQNNETGRQVEFPMITDSYSYKLDLSVLDAGSYSFEVKVNKGSHRKSGTIEILKFNIEQQFLNADIDQLRQLSANTNTTIYFDTQVNQLIEQLISENRFYSIQKISKKSVYLVDITFLLFLLFSSLATEWLIRKYNGLI